MEYDFELDIFISYAHLDNEPLSQDPKGWITMLHEDLQKRLRALLGKEAEIWRDNKLEGSDKFDDTISDKLRRSAILISVLSPLYINSEWCTQGGSRVH